MTSSIRPDHLHTLTLICDALIPSIAVDDDPHGYWRRAASDLNVAQAVAEAIALLPVEQDRRSLWQLIGLFDSRAANLLLCGKPVKFSALAASERETVLRDWQNSRLPLKRQGFQAIKRLAAFAYFAGTTSTGLNPNWLALHYPGPAHPPPSKPPAIVPLDHASLTSRPSPLDCDVVVIGSGAGGGVIAAELAQAGKDVIVVEQGGGYSEADFSQREGEMVRKLYASGGSLVTKDSAILLLAGNCLGGGTTINWAGSLRPPQALREQWEREYGLEGVAGAAFDVSLDAVCERLSVGTGESLINAQNEALRRGCAALGYHTFVIPRNARGCGACDECGYCTFGCQRGAKQSTLVTYLPDAYQRGARFIVNAEARTILIKNGRAAGVELTLTGGAHAVLRARAVVVAAGSIGSPALLLRSGLTNPNIGRHLRLHPTALMAGLYDEPIEAWRGAPMTVACDQFADMGDGYGFTLEVPPMHTGYAAVAFPWTGGRALKQDLLRIAQTAMIFALVKDRDGGRITINRAGQPIVDYWPSAYDRAHLIRGLQEAARIHAAGGAREVRSLHNTPVRWSRQAGDSIESYIERLASAPYQPNTFLLGSAHQMGTCRMGRDPRASVADPFGQAHGVQGLWIGDGSAFPTASGVNPMITIMGLAHRTARYIRESL